MSNIKEILETLVKLIASLIALFILLTCVAAVLYACGITWYMMYDSMFGVVTIGVEYG